MPYAHATSEELLGWESPDPEWEHAYEQLLPRVLNFFRYRLGDDVDAEELTARTFEAAWPARYDYPRDVDGFSTWLLTIARNVAIDHLHARERRAPRVLPASPTNQATKKHRASEHLEAIPLETLLATLPPRQRELIAMKYGAEMTTRAIARATGLPEGRVETILHRAVASLAMGHTNNFVC